MWPIVICVDRALGIVILGLPELCLVFRPWRAIMLRFVSDDDQLLNKSDLKDGALVWAGLLMIRASIFIVTAAYLDNKEVNELAVDSLLLSGLACFGINRYMPNTAKEKVVDSQNKT
jgi:hypothetical protein